MKERAKKTLPETQMRTDTRSAAQSTHRYTQAQAGGQIEHCLAVAQCFE